MKNHLTLVALLGALAGCAQPYARPSLGPEHPASTAAPEAPAPPPSVALEGETAPQGSKEDSTKAGGHDMPGTHGGH